MPPPRRPGPYDRNMGGGGGGGGRDYDYDRRRPYERFRKPCEFKGAWVQITFL